MSHTVESSSSPAASSSLPPSTLTLTHSSSAPPVTIRPRAQVNLTKARSRVRPTTTAATTAATTTAPTTITTPAVSAAATDAPASSALKRKRVADNQSSDEEDEDDDDDEEEEENTQSASLTASSAASSSSTHMTLSGTSRSSLTHSSSAAQGVSSNRTRKMSGLFSKTKIKQLMYEDEEVSKMSAVIPLMVSACVERFIEEFMKQVEMQTNQDRARHDPSIQSHGQRTIISALQLYEFTSHRIASHRISHSLSSYAFTLSHVCVE